MKEVLHLLLQTLARANCWYTPLFFLALYYPAGLIVKHSIAQISAPTSSLKASAYTRCASSHAAMVLSLSHRTFLEPGDLKIQCTPNSKNC